MQTAAGASLLPTRLPPYLKEERLSEQYPTVRYPEVGYRQQSRPRSGQSVASRVSQQSRASGSHASGGVSALPGRPQFTEYVSHVTPRRTTLEKQGDTGHYLQTAIPGYTGFLPNRSAGSVYGARFQEVKAASAEARAFLNKPPQILPTSSTKDRFHNGGGSDLIGLMEKERNQPAPISVDDLLQRGHGRYMDPNRIQDVTKSLDGVPGYTGYLPRRLGDTHYGTRFETRKQIALKSLTDHHLASMPESASAQKATSLPVLPRAHLTSNRK
mmetsp:Transcript_89764/g.159586  ORF Transcript_89764/g.159586 Transcript_89764/m.159586 type:complete len:271 (-) Transcript_89764:222-1034(-)